MSTTTTAAATTPASNAAAAQKAAAASAAGTSGSDAAKAFQTALTASIQDARSMETTSLGSMVAKASKQDHVVAISKPLTTTTSSATSSAAAGSTNSLTGTSSSYKPGGKGAVKVPDELQAYGNGKIPADALEQIGIKKHKLWTVAAEAFKKMRADAADAGVDIGVTDSYRPYDEQVDLAKRKGLYSQGGLAAVPGTSPHGWGMALDVDVTPAGLSWLRQHGAEYGFVEAVPREPWHWEYHGNK